MTRTSSFRPGPAVALLALALGVRPAVAQTLSGTVRGDGRPVAGAEVRLLELDRAQRTGAEGTFLFAGVPAATYRVFVALLGYAPVTDTVRVSAAGARLDVALTLSPIPVAGVAHPPYAPSPRSVRAPGAACTPARRTAARAARSPRRPRRSRTRTPPRQRFY